MIIITPDKIQPSVRFANYHQVAPGDSWQDRTIYDIELILCIEGRFEYFDADGESVQLRIGQILTILPGVQHTLRYLSPSEPGFFSCIHCDLLPNKNWLNRDYRLLPEPQRITQIGRRHILFELFERAAHYFQGYHRYRQAMVQTLVRTIWLSLTELWSFSPLTNYSPRMLLMLDYIRDHITDPITRQDLARKFHITPEHVNYLFKKELSVTPTEFIHHERVLLASRLIRNENLNVQQAALRVGFSDPFYFSRIFKRVLGVPPSKI